MNPFQMAKRDVPSSPMTAVSENRTNAAVSAGPTLRATWARGGAVKMSKKLLMVPPMTDAHRASSRARFCCPLSVIG